MTDTRAPPARPEWAILATLGLVQFVNILDFMMVMPLGPDFAGPLGIPASSLGLVNGGYTLASALAGLAGAFFLDRVGRRAGLVVALFGLALGTAAGGLAQGPVSLIASRVLAGTFGGPATSLTLSIIADVIPGERRGRAMGVVMASFSVASVLGVPAGLWLSESGGWRFPFFAVGALAGAAALVALVALPPLRGHLAKASDVSLGGLLSLLGRPTVRWSYSLTATLMAAGFLVIPNVAAYLQRNLGYPRGALDRLYLLGGLLNFAVLIGGGRLVDRFGSFRANLLGSSVVLTATLFLFARPGQAPNVVAWFVVFMAGMGLRNVSHTTLTTRVPPPAERARFQSLQSCIQHTATGVAAILSTRLLSEGPGGRLEGMPTVAALSMGLTVLGPLLLWNVERRVRAAARA